MTSLLHVPGDIYAVKQLGIESWRENFWAPIPDGVFMELVDASFKLFDRVYLSLDSSLDRDLLLCDFSFYVICLQHLHAIATRSEVERKGGRYIEGALAQELLNPDFNALASAFRPESLRKNDLRFQARRLLKRLRFNAGAGFAQAVFPFARRNAWSIGSWSRLKDDYARRHGLGCDHHYMSTLLREKKPVAAELPARVEDSLNELAHGVAELFSERFDCNMDVDSAWSCWKQRLRDLNAVYGGCVTGRAPETVLLAEVARPLHKAACLGLRRAGAKVVGFHHGNDVCNVYETISAYVEFSHCDVFVCPTRASARFHAEEYATAGISSETPVEFDSVETRKYLELREEVGGEPSSEQIRSVMIMGYPMNAHRYTGNPADWFYHQLDLELSLIDDFRSRGIKVVYKMHPERQQEASGIFEPVCDQVLVEPFETVWRQADAYVFGCTSSTTFGFALCLNRPVIVLDIAGRRWNPDAYGLLSRRCEMVPAWFGEGDRIEYDRNAMARAVDMPRIPLDMDYIDSFMLPGGGRQGAVA